MTDRAWQRTGYAEGERAESAGAQAAGLRRWASGGAFPGMRTFGEGTGQGCIKREGEASWVKSC